MKYFTLCFLSSVEVFIKQKYRVQYIIALRHVDTKGIRTFNPKILEGRHRLGELSWMGDYRKHLKETGCEDAD
jgi:hypothetical protein